MNTDLGKKLLDLPCRALFGMEGFGIVAWSSRCES